MPAEARAPVVKALPIGRARPMDRRVRAELRAPADHHGREEGDRGQEPSWISSVVTAPAQAVVMARASFCLRGCTTALGPAKPQRERHVDYPVVGPGLHGGLSLEMRHGPEEASSSTIVIRREELPERRR